MRHKKRTKLNAVILAFVLLASTVLSNLSFVRAAEVQGDSQTSTSAQSVNTSSDLLDLNNWNTISGDMSHISKDNDTLVFSPVSSGRVSDSMIMPKADVLAEYGDILVQVSYKMLKAANTSGNLPIVYDYTDEQNYKYLNFIYNERWGGWAAQFYSVKDGTGTISSTKTGLNLDFSDWVTLTLDYTTNGEVTFRFESALGDDTITAGVTNGACFILASLHKYSKISYKDFHVLGIAEDDVRMESKFIENFREEYWEILYLSENMQVVNYLDAVEEAIQDYSELSEYAKAILAKEYKKLQSLKTVLEEKKTSGETEIEERAKDDYSTIVEDFEHGLTRWSNIIEGKAAPEIVTDTETGSKVLKLSSCTALGMNSFSYPESAFVKKLSYRVKIDGKVKNAFYGLNIPLGYVDEYNWKSLSIYRIDDADTKLSYRERTSVDGVKNVGSSSNRVLTNKYDNVWLNVTIEYSEVGTAIISISDGVSATADVITTKSIAIGKTALLGMALDTNRNTTVYYDDVTIELEKGDFDIDKEIENVNVYYSGNTGVQGDDVVTLQGEALYDTLSKVYIAKVSDDAIETPGYVKQMDFSHMGTESAYIEATEAVEVWKKATSVSQARKMNLLQFNDKQVKFVIPEELGKGIFILKLEGFDTSSEQDDAYYLLNMPKISYFLGTDATICNPGETLRIVGENLALYDARIDDNDYIQDSYQSNDYLNNAVQVLLKNGNNEYILSGDAITVKAEQYINVTLPLDMVPGEYEVMLYNGFGDGSCCWSMPCETRLTVGNSPCDTWAKTVFNVKDFGATGDNDQNATGYVIDALTAASENVDSEGRTGGIVYFPKGVYTLIHSIVIPENVQIIGDGIDNSILLWTPDQWCIGDLPPFLFGMTKNVVVKDISFYGSRVSTLFAAYSDGEKNENIYFENVDIYFDQWAGNPTEGNWTATSTKELSSTEMKALIEQECGTAFLIRIEDGYNIHLTDVSAYRRLGRGISGESDYIFASNVNIKNNWSSTLSHHSIYEYCAFDNACNCQTGNGLLYYGCKFADSTGNNRELYVADGQPRNLGGASYLILKKDTSDLSGCTYYLQNFTKGKDLWAGFQVYVTTGQGTGQVRRIATNEDNKIVLDSPFAIEPNSNGTVTIRSAREDTYFVHNYYRNGLATGHYSGCANVIYNGNEWSKVTDIYQEARYGDALWYITYTNGYYHDSFNIHNYGQGNKDRTGFSYLNIFVNEAQERIMGYNIRDNVFDGYTFYIHSVTVNGIKGITFDKNTFMGVDYAITTYGLGNTNLEGVSGVFMYKNLMEDVIALNANTSAKEHRDIYGELTYWEYVDVDGTDSLKIGDVNGDGEISLRDCTMIKLYLTEQVTLDTEQLLRADFYADTTVTLRDATAILHYIITSGEILKPALPNDGYFDGDF